MVTYKSQIWARAGKPLRVDPAKVKVPPYYPDTPIIQRDIARYYDNIMVMDSLAGEILRQLEADGLLNNTIVVFFSDHGAGLPWFKRELYDRGLHVPFVVRYPNGQLAGTTDADLHSLVDLAPTMLSLTATPIPAHLQGQAFLGSQRANNSSLRLPRSYVFGARDRMDEQYDRVRVVRDKRYKYVRNYQPEKPHYQAIAYRKQMPLMKEILRLRDAGQLTGIPARWFRTKAPEELYDTDPYELKNVIDDPAYGAQRTWLRRALDDHLARVGDTGTQPERAMVRRMYGGDAQPQTAPPVITASASGVTLNYPTGGASIAYQLDGEERWRLANGPIAVPTGRTLRAKAIQYGY